MKTCPECGAAFADDAAFCGECGAKLEDHELRALLPPEDRDNPNLPNLLYWRIQKFSIELFGMTTKMMLNGSFGAMHTYFEDCTRCMPDGVEGLDDEEILDIFAEMEEIPETEGLLDESKAVLRDHILEILRFVHDNLWMFEAANILLRRAGKEEFDLDRLRFQGMSLKDFEDCGNNSEILDAIQEGYQALCNYGSDISNFVDEIGEKLDELIWQ